MYENTSFVQFSFNFRTQYMNNNLVFVSTAGNYHLTFDKNSKRSKKSRSILDPSAGTPAVRRSLNFNTSSTRPKRSAAPQNLKEASLVKKLRRDKQK